MAGRECSEPLNASEPPELLELLDPLNPSELSILSVFIRFDTSKIFFFGKHLFVQIFFERFFFV
ncbi:MAG: hypothetical protein PHH67_07565 [Methanosarcina sp.]|nr:hypothetical protein [Methanosarcina sp.]MDD4306353.1 hypothetical protein [Methanosarcina sp.]